MAAITRGVIFVHSATRAMCPHIEWAVGNVLGKRASFDWTDQPAGTGLLRAEVAWQGPQGTGDGAVWTGAVGKRVDADP